MDNTPERRKGPARGPLLTTSPALTAEQFERREAAKAASAQWFNNRPREAGAR